MWVFLLRRCCCCLTKPCGAWYKESKSYLFTILRFYILTMILAEAAFTILILAFGESGFDAATITRVSNWERDLDVYLSAEAGTINSIEHGFYSMISAALGFIRLFMKAFNLGKSITPDISQRTYTSAKEMILERIVALITFVPNFAIGLIESVYSFGHRLLLVLLLENVQPLLPPERAHSTTISAVATGVFRLILLTLLLLALVYVPKFLDFLEKRYGDSGTRRRRDSDSTSEREARARRYKRKDEAQSMPPPSTAERRGRSPARKQD